jgi:hypothetical protein
MPVKETLTKARDVPSEHTSTMLSSLPLCRWLARPPARRAQRAGDYAAASRADDLEQVAVLHVRLADGQRPRELLAVPLGPKPCRFGRAERELFRVVREHLADRLRRFNEQLDLGPALAAHRHLERCRDCRPAAVRVAAVVRLRGRDEGGGGAAISDGLSDDRGSAQTWEGRRRCDGRGRRAAGTHGSSCGCRCLGVEEVLLLALSLLPPLVRLVDVAPVADCS